jgi:outer membrane protein OmpA-like peptidoglycan-associated protein
VRHCFGIAGSIEGAPNTRSRRARRRAYMVAIFAMGIVLTPCAGAQGADSPTDAQILDALKAKRLTRCPHSGLTSVCSDPTSPAEVGPKISTEIFFHSGSASLSQTAVSALKARRAELRKSILQNAELIIAGYADAKGGAAYNQRLSQRRAEAVKRYVMRHFTLGPNQLQAIGLGKIELKNTANPFAAENRRVEIITKLSAGTESPVSLDGR